MRASVLETSRKFKTARFSQKSRCLESYCCHCHLVFVRALRRLHLSKERKGFGKKFVRNCNGGLEDFLSLFWFSIVLVLDCCCSLVSTGGGRAACPSARLAPAKRFRAERRRDAPADAPPPPRSDSSWRSSRKTQSDSPSQNCVAANQNQRTTPSTHLDPSAVVTSR